MTQPSVRRAPHSGRGRPFLDRLDVTPGVPELVVEVDVARDGAGRWRHPARRHRMRPDLFPVDVLHFAEGAAG